MQNLLNETHDPALRSWVASAQATAADFPIQNLPFGVLRRRGSDEAFRGGVAIGDYTDFFTSMDHATNTGRPFRPTSNSNSAPTSARAIRRAKG
jgi:hypothetical protein